MSKLENRITKLEAIRPGADADVIEILSSGRSRRLSGRALDELPLETEVRQQVLSRDPRVRELGRARLRAGLFQREEG